MESLPRPRACFQPALVPVHTARGAWAVSLGRATRCAAPRPPLTAPNPPLSLLPPPSRPQTFIAWMNIFQALVTITFPEEAQPRDRVDREAWPWWKVKKWALHICNRLFSRYGDPKESRNAQLRQFAQRFASEWSCKARVRCRRTPRLPCHSVTNHHADHLPKASAPRAPCAPVFPF